MIGDIATTSFTEIMANESAYQASTARYLEENIPVKDDRQTINKIDLESDAYLSYDFTFLEKGKSEGGRTSRQTSAANTFEPFPLSSQSGQNPEEQKPSPAFINLNVRKKINEILALLPDIEKNLGSPVCAPYVVETKEVFEDIWNLIDYLPREQSLLISAIEEVFRGKKWREFQLHHIQLIDEKLREAKNDNLSMQEIAKSISKIQKSGLDIFPSSMDEDDFDHTDHET